MDFAIGQRIKLMFTGDSITVGTNSTSYGGYRADLLARITNYLGHSPVSCGWDVQGFSGETRMCGGSGLTTNECRARTITAAPAFSPDAVFLMIGTNDTTQLASSGGPNSVVQSMGYVTSILDDFRSANPECVVFVANLVDNQVYPTAVNTYNSALSALLLARSDYTAGLVVPVNMNAALGPWAAPNFGDATHPAYAGYTLMADAWYAAFITKF